jgi:uncharacterized protein YkwD
MNINFVDLLLLLVVVLSVLVGWQRGFILSLLDLIRWVGSLLLALRFYSTVASWIEAYTQWSDVWTRPLAFLLVLFLAGAVIQLLGHALLRRIPREVHKRAFNRILGLFPGFISGVITAAILAPLLLALPLPESLSNGSRNSVVANRLAVLTERLEDALTPIFDEAIKRSLTMRTVKPDSTEVVKLPYTVEDPTPRPDLEAQMLVLINNERAKAGLKPLAPDPELTEVARRHSADMFKRGYFAHNTPEGITPFDRIQEAGIRFRVAGENLALAPSLEIAHTGLMNSPGHRANILRPEFGRVGIGIMDGGWRGLMVSQEFRD